MGGFDYEAQTTGWERKLIHDLGYTVYQQKTDLNEKKKQA